MNHISVLAISHFFQLAGHGRHPKHDDEYANFEEPAESKMKRKEKGDQISDWENRESMQIYVAKRHNLHIPFKMFWQ